MQRTLKAKQEAVVSYKSAWELVGYDVLASSVSRLALRGTSVSASRPALRGVNVSRLALRGTSVSRLPSSIQR